MDGHELRFAVNYLAGYLLVRRSSAARAARRPRGSSTSARQGRRAIDFDDVMLERSYNGVQAYCQSKLAQVMLTYDLGRRSSRAPA